jgi:hypothetical protein
VSGKVTGWFLRHPDGPDELAYRMVLAVMADAADIDAGNIHGASRHIAERSRLSVRYTRALIERALADHWLEVLSPGDRRRPALYRFPSSLWAPDRPEVMRGPGTRITAVEKDVMRAGAAHTCAPQERAQSAPQERAPTVLTVSTGLAPTPTPTPQGGRSGATGIPAAAPLDQVGQDEAIRKARDRDAARCGLCDEIGWDEAAGRWCQHPPEYAMNTNPQEEP